MVLHPAIVHFPITFFITSSLLDITTRTPTSLLQPLINLTTTTATLGLRSVSPADFVVSLHNLSYITTVAGLIFALPASASGALAAYGSIFKWRGLNLKDEVVRTNLFHVLLSYTAILTAAYNWWTRRDAPGFESSNLNVVLSVLLLVATGLSGSLGGKLTYEHGVQVRRKVVGDGRGGKGEKKEL